MKKRNQIAVIAASALLLAPFCTAALPTYAAAASDSAEQPALTTIASISKIFSTTAVLQLAEEGKVDLDAPVTEYLPDFKMKDPRYRDITVRMLMNHTSGLMGTTGAGFMLLNDRDITAHDLLLERLSSQTLKTDPGNYGTYCNDGFTLLELITEQVSGESFTEYLQNHISKPLGLTATGTPWDAAYQSPAQADTYLGGANFATDYCMTIGSGGVLSTAPELCKFGTAFFKGNTTLLSDKTKAEMNRRNAADQYEDGFGLGWDEVTDPDYEAAGVKVVSKGGDVAMQHGELLVAPDEKISVAVLTSGGGSGQDSLFGQALLDIALQEKGITVTHAAPQQKETLSEVPASYLSYEGVYSNGSALLLVSFPQQKYMEITNLDEAIAKPQQFMFTTEDSFVLMEGSIEGGRAVQAHNQTVLTFRKRGSKEYICSDSISELGALGRSTRKDYYAERVNENKISEETQKKWDALNGKKYYVYSEKYSSTNYCSSNLLQLHTTPEAPGYVNSLKIIDDTHAEPFIQIPGFGGRDLTGIALSRKDGKEFCTLTSNFITLISEDSMPAFSDDIRTVALHNGQAAWYTIGESMQNKTITLDIPEHAAVYVYDKSDNVTYSSYMKDYGRNVTLPANGKIVFLGENGGSVTIS